MNILVTSNNNGRNIYLIMTAFTGLYAKIYASTYSNLNRQKSNMDRFNGTQVASSN